MSDILKPPVAQQRTHDATHHGKTISDPYAWLRDAGYPEVTDPDVLDYLKAENAFFEGHMAPHGELVETIYQEMKGRIKEDDRSVPQKDGHWIHWFAYETGGQYPIHYRKPVAGGPDEILFHEPKEAGDKEYFNLGILEISPDDRLMAWAVDDDGAERYTLTVRDIATGEDLETVSRVVNGDVVWAADSQSFFYTEVNENWRSYRVLLHKIGTDPKTDRVIYEEADDGFQVGIGDTQDEQWVVISTGDNQTSEMRIIPAADPEAVPVIVSPRQVKRLYALDSAHGKFWIVTNDDHLNFRLAQADWATPGEWTTVIAGSDRVYLTGASSFKKHLILSQRVDGLDEIVLRDYDTGAQTRIPFAEASYSAGLSSNPEYDPDVYRVSYSSMVTPRTTYDYDPETQALTTLKVQQIPSGYDASQYETERVVVTARDGAKVPVSVVYKKGFPRDGSGKLYLYAYGAYGYAIPPGFSTNRLSLLDRGYAFAIAHIRGGDDLGYNWYLQGKAEDRWNTFHDFVDVAKGLIAENFTSAGKIAINGGSAGGELMGVVANTDPDLWGVVVADVPFVDVLSTMLDASLPLTPGEWPEWGNPIESEAAYDLIRSYSPYDNVAAKDYPPMLITGGLNDPRVTYWEPAKWAARLRATKTDDNLLLLKINMGAGHGGKSGRFESLREDAESFAFVLWQLGDAGGA